MTAVAVLFARADSIYKTISGCDVWDIERDARRWPGGAPIIAHPPCRAWGSLRHFAKPRPDERELAPWAVDRIRENGGVLEHPRASRLWPEYGLPLPGAGRDQWGGWSVCIDQDWWGHRAEKRTLLYVVGCGPRDLPVMPLRLDEPSHVVRSGAGLRSGMPGYRPQLRKPEREATPPALAHWLVDVASRCRVSNDG